MTDGLGTVTTYTYDDLGRIENILQPWATGQPNIITQFRYDIRSLLTRMTTGNGQHWYTTYNVWGLQEKYVEPSTTAYPASSNRTFTTVYDASGRPVTEQLPGGNLVTTVYDNLGRVTSASGGAAGGSRAFTYDADGRMVTFSHPNGTGTIAYDDRSQVTSVAGGPGASSFQYDSKGRMTQRVDSAGITTYGWSPRDQLTGLTDPVTGNSRTYTWNDAGELDLVNYGNGITRDYVWDGIGRLQSDTLLNGSTTLRSETYGYDLNSRMTSRTVTPGAVAGAGSNAYTYDKAGRLSSWQGPGSGSPTSYTWDYNGNLLTAGPKTFTYDARNRMLTEGGKTYNWSARGTLNSTVAGSTTTNYTFDGFGQMTAAAGVTYQYDALGRMARRGSTTLTYSGLLTQPTGDGTSFVARSPQGSPVAVGDGPTEVHLAANSHGDVIGAFTGSGLHGHRLLRPVRRRTGQSRHN